MGRYEAGTTVSSGSGIRGELLIKEGVAPYNNIKWGNSMTDPKGGAVEVSKEMYKDNDSVTSTLIYGVQWDAIMQFIDPKYKNEDGTITGIVKNSTGRGNYNEDENQNDWRGTQAITGASADYKVKNIYDLAGNIYEWTMEFYIDNTNSFRVFRGGHLTRTGFDLPISVRSTAQPSEAYSKYYGFRTTLYIAPPEAGKEVSEKPDEWTSDKVTPITDGEGGVIP